MMLPLKNEHIIGRFAEVHHNFARCEGYVLEQQENFIQKALLDDA